MHEALASFMFFKSSTILFTSLLAGVIANPNEASSQQLDLVCELPSRFTGVDLYLISVDFETGGAMIGGLRARIQRVSESEIVLLVSGAEIMEMRPSECGEGPCAGQIIAIGRLLGDISWWSPFSSENSSEGPRKGSCEIFDGIPKF